MSPIVIAAGAALVVIVFSFAIAARFASDTTGGRQRSVLERIQHGETGEDVSLARRDVTADIGNPMVAMFVRIPPIKKLYELGLLAGFYGKMHVLAIVGFVIFLGVWVALSKTQFAVIAPFAGLIFAWFVIYKFTRSKIQKRNDKFIHNFPDAIDMIVRSVRSGHPLNTALRMIAENAEPPVSTEFKQVVDEIAYGRSLVEALSRLATRIGEADLQFFIVVLSVQQETGGNLAEVLSNLAGIIRKRKQLRLKIRAITSEGRATAVVLGALPVLVFGALMATSPNYLDPLFHTGPGQIILASAIGLIVTAFVVVRQMVNIDI